MNSDSFLKTFRDNTSGEILCLVDDVWKKKDFYFRWPMQPLVLIPGCVREKYHSLDEELTKKLKRHGISIDTRSNGPAIMTYLFADGERPLTEDGKGWPIHHIYDGRHIPPRRTQCSHAVKDGTLFTNSSGLVAIHPAIEGLAHENGYLAWLLRMEAFLRFGFDPDEVFPCFRDESQEVSFLEKYALRFDGYKFQEDSGIEEKMYPLVEKAFSGVDIDTDSLEKLDQLCLLFLFQRALRHAMSTEGLGHVYDAMRRMFIATSGTVVPTRYATEYLEEWSAIYDGHTSRYTEAISNKLNA